MREILFRGKNVYGEWKYGSLIMQGIDCHISDGSMFTRYEKSDRAYFKYQFVIPETVGQYIGLTDKNGKKIFEGDIIQSHAHGSKKIVFNHEIKYGAFVPKGYCQAWYSDLYDFGFYAQYKNNQNMIPYDTSRIEVIGNIHDNPELMEVDT